MSAVVYLNPSTKYQASYGDALYQLEFTPDPIGGGTSEAIVYGGANLGTVTGIVSPTTNLPRTGIFVINQSGFYSIAVSISLSAAAVFETVRFALSLLYLGDPADVIQRVESVIPSQLPGSELAVYTLRAEYIGYFSAGDRVQSALTNNNANFPDSFTYINSANTFIRFTKIF